MQFQKSLLTATLLAVASLTAVSANAAVVTDTFDVKITIQSVCDVATGATKDINFGPVAAGVVPEPLSSEVSVLCSLNTPFVVNMSPTGGATNGTGTMTGPGTAIGFKLTKDAGGASAWGNTGLVAPSAAGNGVQGVGTGMATPVINQVYATITGSTDVLPGLYSNTVTVAVTY